MAEKSSVKRYAYLELLTTEQLQDMLRMDCRGVDSFEQDMIVQILDILAKREEGEQSSDVNTAWNDFQTYYNTPDGEGQSLYGEETQRRAKPAAQRKGRASRRIALIAASVAVFFCLIVMVQAAGVDVLGTIARWTDNTFRFEPTRHASAGMADAEITQPLRDALEENDIPTQLAPLWIPVGYEPGQVAANVQETSATVSCDFADRSGKYASVCISVYYADAAVGTTEYQKDDGEVEAYASNGRMFYVFSNQSEWTGVWSNGQYSISISGNMTKTELLQIIDSIREVPTE